LVGILPDGLRLLDRLTGLQLICYSGLLRGMDRATVIERAPEPLGALGLADEGGTLVVDYSAGMTLEERFVQLVGGATDVGVGLGWLRSSSR